MGKQFFACASGLAGRTPFYALSVNCLYRDRVWVKVRDRVSGRVRVRACHPDSSGNLLTGRKMELARL